MSEPLQHLSSEQIDKIRSDARREAQRIIRKAQALTADLPPNEMAYLTTELADLAVKAANLGFAICRSSSFSLPNPTETT